MSGSGVGSVKAAASNGIRVLALRDRTCWSLKGFPESEISRVVPRNFSSLRSLWPQGFFM